MGTSNSRTKICKVTPKQEQPLHQTASPRLITAGQYLPQHQQGIRGHQQIRQLPPLKQHVPQLVHLPSDSQNVHAEPIHSIIKSHPPQKPKAWQAVACQMELAATSKASDENVTMGCHTPKFHSMSGRRCGAGSSLQTNHGKFLQAQTLLIGQATKKRQSRQKHLRERRIFTLNIAGACNGQTERTNLVSRPTQRDIFWDQTTGQNLDLRELLQPSPHLTDPDTEIEELPGRQNLEVGLKAIQVLKEPNPLHKQVDYDF
ncbi:hypothetical protein HF521_021454 [Silurus meridionalis]|uniref:Uncharacterized protein n=1 Tax=Silurus meridionalis TaxID=175797 RepID=A0A8T0BB87_SILME|nr:hypothetical protein HF521_021454 [Silurus meridionalis]